MAIRKIREIGDEVLTKVCKEVTKMTPRTTELIDDMLETMYELKFLKSNFFIYICFLG